MGLSPTVPTVRQDDWNSVIQFNRFMQKYFGKLTSTQLGSGSAPTFSGVTITGLTANRLVYSDSSKALSSVSDLTSWIAGTANEIDITDDGDGTVTIGIVDPLIVSKGGTGAASLTDHSLLAGSGTGAITALGAATNGQIPIGRTGADPILATLTGTVSQVTVTNGYGTITLSLPQNIATSSSPSFNALTITQDLRVNDLTASRLVASNASKELSSTDIVSWIAGTANQITVTDDADGSVTLSTPQDIHTSASPTFSQLVLSDTTTPLYAGPWTGVPSPISAHSSVYGDLFVGNVGASTARVRILSNSNAGEFNWNEYYTGSTSEQLDATKPTYSIKMDGANDKLYIRRAAAASSPISYTTLGYFDSTGLSLGTLELVCGSINRASGTLTMEIGGTSLLNIDTEVETNNVRFSARPVGDTTIAEAIRFGRTGSDLRYHSIYQSCNSSTNSYLEFRIHDGGGSPYTGQVAMFRLYGSIPRMALMNSCSLAVDSLTASRPISCDSNKVLTSTTFATWIAGTANQITVTDDGDGSVTLSTPQNIHTGATPTFAGLTITNYLFLENDATYGNTGIGYNALSSLTSGSGLRNTAFGVSSLLAVTTGDDNAGMGVAAGRNVNTGSRNMCIGTFSGYYNQTGDDNVAIGVYALQGTDGQSSSDSVGLGYSALFYCYGDGNIGIGYAAGLGVTTGAYNVMIGFRAGSRQTTNSNLLIIDNQDRSSAANELTTSLIYGTFAAAAANQFLRVNGEIRGSVGAKIGDGGSTNYTTIETDGTIKFNGAATVFNDANVGSLVLTGPASTRPGTVTYYDEVGADTGIACLGFAVNEAASGAIEIPHSYKEGSDLVFHVHWQGIAAPTGTDYVKWQLKYTVVDSVTGETVDAATTIVVESAFDTQYKMITSNFPTITGTNFKHGEQFLFQLSRIAAAGDAYAGEALAATVGLHYECDTVGSRQITTK